MHEACHGCPEQASGTLLVCNRANPGENMSDHSAPLPSTTTTLINNAAWVIAWDASRQAHTYRTDIDVAFAGDRITFIGKDFDGKADRVIDGRERMVMPGLIDAHTHPTTEPSFKGIREEHGVTRMGNSGLYERMIAYKLDEEGRKAALEVAYAEMLASGVTTVVDLSSPFDDWTDLVDKSGIRAFLAPGYRSAEWRLEPDFSLHFDWDEAAGRRGFEAALKLIDIAGGVDSALFTCGGNINNPALN